MANRRTKKEVEQEKHDRREWFESLSRSEQETIWLQYYEFYTKKLRPIMRSYFKSYTDKEELDSKALIEGFNQYIRFVYGKEKNLKIYKGYEWEKLYPIIINNVKHEIILDIQKQSAATSIEEIEENTESDFILEYQPSIKRKLWKYLVKIYRDLQNADMEAAQFFANIYMGRLIFKSKEAFIHYLEINQRKVILLKFWLNQLYGVQLKRLY